MNRWGALVVAGFAAAVAATCTRNDAPAITMNSAVVVDEQGRVPDLVCPGAIGCEDASGPLLVGAAKRDVTPTLEKPVWMAGFGNGRAATGVHDPIWVRALSARRGATRLGLAVVDTVGFFHDDVVRIRQGAAALGFDHVVFTSTHNHEAKDTMGMWGESATVSAHDDAYQRRIVDAAIDALKEARDAEKATGVRVAGATAQELVGDTRDPVLADEGVHTLVFGGDQPFATLSVWGNHPEALGDDNKLITSDWVHYFREEMEQKYPGSISLLFQGNLGGLTTPLVIKGCPDAEGNETCPTGTFEKAEYVGRGAARKVITALDGAGATVDADPQLSLRRHSFLLASANSLMSIAVYLRVLPRVLWLDDGTRIPIEDTQTLQLRDVLDGRARVQTEVNAFRLGPVSFLTVPGELYAELWLGKGDGTSLVIQPEGADFPEAKIDPPLSSLLPDAPFKVVLNQANDAIGYLIPKAQWDVKDPRAFGGQYGEENSTGPDSAALVFKAASELMSLELK